MAKVRDNMYIGIDLTDLLTHLLTYYAMVTTFYMYPATLYFTRFLLLRYIFTNSVYIFFVLTILKEGRVNYEEGET